MLKSQRKALEDAEKANTISLEEFLEVEVSIYRSSCVVGTAQGDAAAQTGHQPDTRHSGDVRKVEADTYGQETSRGGSYAQSQGNTGCSRQEQRDERKRYGECLVCLLLLVVAFSTPGQFTYNPEWFEEEEEEEEDDWDLSKYRRSDGAYEGELEEDMQNLDVQDGNEGSGD